MVLGQLVIYMLKTKSTLRLCTNINFRWIIALIMRGKTIKILENKIFSFKNLLFLILEEGKAGRKSKKHRREWETLVGCLPYTPNQGPNLHPRQVPQPGIKPAILHLQDDALPKEPHQLRQKNNIFSRTCIG